ncbi:MAG TPA: helicase-exonuclease AddAB subunit AddA, partial [Pseudogracilibacillus sp.]|nr:helicase-exonuclease AddAB subunit AddA [Pseudogracilibacillus sp.]
ASISTLHAFCTTVVRQYAYLIDVDPSFRIADEMEMELMKQDILDELLESYYGEEDVSSAFFTVVDMFSSDRNDDAVGELILKLYTFAMQNPWPENWLHDVASTYQVDENTTEASITWLEYLKEEVREQLHAFSEQIKRAMNIARESDGPYHYIEALEDDLHVIHTALEKSDVWDELQQYMTESTIKNLSKKRVECNEDKKANVQAIRKPFRDQWNKWKKSWFSRDFQAHMKDMQVLHPVIQKVTQLVLAFKHRFETKKREQAIVDFSDLEHFCLQILVDSTSTEDNIIPSQVAQQYKHQFKEILVDEYQDINIVQETILSVISDEEGDGNMFMVGDVKQSVYRFRHAEPTLFIDKYERFEVDPNAGYRIDLAKNFRSRKEVLSGANFLFRQVFDEGLGEIAYDEKAELVYGNKGYDDHVLENPEIELSIIDREKPEEREDGAENVEDVEKLQLEARLYAEKINRWVGKKDDAPIQVVDKATNAKRDIQYRDIVILQRSLTGAPVIVDELKKQGIPVHAELRTGYFVAIEIQVMMNMLKIIDNPHQDIPIASVLRSPIVGLDEEQLAQIRLSKDRVTYYEAVKTYVQHNQDETSELLERFLTQLHSFRTLAKEGALSALIWEIYQETGYFDFVGGIPGGKQRQANLRALYDRARGYESTSFRGLFRFLRFIENMQEQEKDLGEARALSEQEDVVRIMTIHKSKGLEFPVVIVGGMNKEFNFQDLRSTYMLDKDLGFATKFIDPVKRIMYPTLYYIALQQHALRKLLAEEMRVLYVAMTRAKEKLVMIGNVPSYEKEIDKWLPVLEHEDWVLPTELRKSAKTYLDWVGPAVMRHNQAAHIYEEMASDSMIPEMIFADTSKWKVEYVPGTSLLNLDEQTLQSSTELQTIIENWQSMDDLNEDNAQTVAERLNFKYTFDEAKRTRAKQSVTEIKRRQETIDAFSDNQIVKPFRAPLVKEPKFLQTTTTLSAAEIGTAMHAVMQFLPLTKQWNQEEIANKVEQYVHEEKLTAEEADAIQLDAIERFFQTDLAKQMMEAERVEREVPFTYALDAKAVYPDWESDTKEQVLIQGVIDCIIYTEDGAILVDYKTDKIDEAEVSDALIQKLKARYATQITLYEQALSDILKTKINAAYLYFFSQDLLINMK